ncbi:BatA domain-containing protein [Maribacter sp. MAR_2009_72]|uniref:BatA domain-containing protein n=1 Tax=Maribacter sp. MAR_2009_72 TaxID=1250050 RepID=UPI0011995597|nr:BatA domain-containing protein [Maribacter sp. MAR_2009_72]TVZ14743.1 putative membrane protein (TIGR02226 family) [Maribacter sp. MAR_2009_72]
MSFAHPSYLWALLGLLVPIAIHLWSKKEAKTIKIGSVQWLSESKSKQSSSIQLNEWWLLVLRMGIISLLVLLMAKPQWQSKVSNTSLTYIIEPELVQYTGFMSRFNEISDDQEIRLLRKGLPLKEKEQDIIAQHFLLDYWGLASEMDALQTDSIVVFTKGLAKGLKGARPETKHKMHWVVIDSALAKETPLLAYKKKNGLQLFTGKSTPFDTKVTNKNVNLGDEFTLSNSGDSLVISGTNPVDKIPVYVQKSIKIALYYTDSLQKDKSYIEASLKALSIYLDREIQVESSLDTEVVSDKEADAIIWLSAKPSPKTTKKLLAFKEDALSQSMVIPGVEKHSFYLTKRINSENAITERLTEQLLQMLEVNGEVEKLVAEVDHRSVSTAELETTYTPSKKKQKQMASQNVNPYLWLILLVLLLVERFVAYKRKQ